MLSFLNQLKSFSRTTNSSKNPIIVDGGRASLKFNRSTSSPYFMQATIPPRLAPSEMPSDPNPSPSSYPEQKSSTMIPPPHWHANQDETFRVESGSMLAVRSGEKQLLEPGEEIFIPRGDYHTFSNGSSESELVVDVKLNPDNRLRDERFFRNGYSYLADCQKAGITPSPFQVMLFLFSADVIPALPGPKFVMRPLARFIAWFGGVVVGKHIMGYREYYEEYTPQELINSKMG